MIKIKASFVFCLFLLSMPALLKAQPELTKYVDPMIGTGGHGHTYPGAALPFGMVQLGPDSPNEGWDWCSGYAYSDDTITGFSHNHLSGTGGGDFGDILLFPCIGDAENQRGMNKSKFSHANEIAEAGYYSVILDDSGIRAELTAALRSGFHRYTFPQSQSSDIIINLEHGISDKCIDAKINITGSKTVEGYRRSSGWNTDHTVYFVAEFSKPFKSHGIFSRGQYREGADTASSSDIKAYLKYSTSKDEAVMVKVGISHVSIEGARKNLRSEIEDWDFDRIRNNAKDSWENELTKIIVDGGTNDELKTFYTALYHAMLSPNIFSDIDGAYPGMDGKIKYAKDFNMYTVFSLWDTYRGLHPLLSIIDQKRTADFVKSLYEKYKESGLLPVWELASFETQCMIGYHAVPVIYDAYRKGIVKKDAILLFEAMKKSAMADDFGLQYYKSLGYAPCNKTRESVSRTLEYGYDDWCIAEMAASLGKNDDHEKFAARAKSYINIFDGSSAFMRGKDSRGGFVTPFSPFAVTREYTEANAWQYSFYVPQDVRGLINLHGGVTKFEEKLDEAFTTKKPLEGNSTLADISGVIGQYAHGNEPSHHMALLFSYTGQEWKTQEYVRKIMSELYTAKPDGLCGNEDCGQMSAWYVLNAMGFYPVCPGTNQYIIGSPLFKHAKVRLENGNYFTVDAPDNSADNKYISSVLVNGKKYSKTYLDHEMLMNGGRVEFAMSPLPLKNIHHSDADLPYSLSSGKTVSAPYPVTSSTVFLDSASVAFGCRTDSAEIRYTTDGSVPSKHSMLYASPIKISQNEKLTLRAFHDGYNDSPVQSIEFYKFIPFESASVPELVPGMNYRYVEGAMKSAYDVEKLSAKKSGVCDTISLLAAEQEDHYGFEFSGYMNIPERGMYKFYTESDDGSILIIDGKEVLNNDGSHGAFKVEETVGLTAGYHSFRLLYFEDYEGQELKAGIEYNSGKKMEFSSSWIYREIK
jgi:predicted alpha-1,2-mannosidase